MKTQLLPITVLFRYEDLHGPEERRYPGFLTSSNHAMYTDTNSVFFVEVKRTDNPSVYLGNDGTGIELGQIDNPSRAAEIIQGLSDTLNNMTAYEFMTKVIFNVVDEIGFDQLIIPNLINAETGSN